MHWHTIWFHYVYGSLLGNGPEALVQTVVYALIAVAIWPPSRKAIERFAERHVKSIKDHAEAETKKVHDRLSHHEALLNHIITHSDDIPAFDPKEHHDDR